MVTLVPSNDNLPNITLLFDEQPELVEGGGAYVFPDLLISDGDQSPCSEQLLVAAQVTVETMAADSDQDILRVSMCGGHKETLYKYSVQLISGVFEHFCVAYTCGKFMVCMAHKPQCKTLHFPKHKFPPTQTEMHLKYF